MFSICIWMNTPSHHQSAFFHSLDERDDIDLRVVYMATQSANRIAEGWKEEHAFQPFEICLPSTALPAAGVLEHVPDWQGRIHIICSYFGSSLIDLFCKKGVSWCHWSEAPGYRLAGLLGFRMTLFRILSPLMLVGKRGEGRRIGTYALGAFSQGELARRAFRLMGVPDVRIADLYYVPAALQPMEPLDRIVQFAAGRKVMLSTAALCRRKGIDVLLKAYARLRSENWCLVLCGLDRADGAYQALSRKLGIADRVLFLGVHPSERIAEVYAASHLFILPSRFDGWGAVLNEASSLGLPLISTDLCGAAWHIIEDGRNGYRVRAGSVDALAKSLNKYNENPDLIHRHGQASMQRYNEMFTPDKNAGRLVDALQKWLNT